jgi:hypothetical protein
MKLITECIPEFVCDESIHKWILSQQLELKPSGRVMKKNSQAELTAETDPKESYMRGIKEGNQETHNLRGSGSRS